VHVDLEDNLNRLRPVEEAWDGEFWPFGNKMKMAKLLREEHFADEIMGSPQPQK